MPSSPTDKAFTNQGIEVREFYAAYAMMGLLANPGIYTPRIAKDQHRKFVAALSYLIADQMIAASSLPIPTLNANVAAANLERDA